MIYLITYLSVDAYKNFSAEEGQASIFLPILQYNMKNIAVSFLILINRGGQNAPYYT